MSKKSGKLRHMLKFNGTNGDSYVADARDEMRSKISQYSGVIVRDGEVTTVSNCTEESFSVYLYKKDTTVWIKDKEHGYVPFEGRMVVMWRYEVTPGRVNFLFLDITDGDIKKFVLDTYGFSDEMTFQMCQQFFALFRPMLGIQESHSESPAEASLELKDYLALEDEWMKYQSKREG